jgi:4-hydroxybenzoate polyprenyltransferase
MMTGQWTLLFRVNNCFAVIIFTTQWLSSASEPFLMKLTAAFLKLIRWPNLLFICLTQLLFYYCFVYPPYSHQFADYKNVLTPGLFYLLALASLLIAAAGYIINDYFDLNIDRINKPGEQVIGTVIRRRWAIIWHMLFSSLGVFLSFYISFRTGNLLIGSLNLLAVVLLWFYSTTFKKQLLIGNITISLLTAWVILVLYFSEVRFYLVFSAINNQHLLYIRQLFKIAILYGAFAFIISLIREVIKDMEDMYGDEKYGCQTMPIIWGIPASKVFVATWLVVLIGALIIIQVYVMQLQWWWFAAYSILLIIAPLLNILRKLFSSFNPPDYHRLSSLLKMVMFTGILSMILFKYYHTKTVFGI